MITALIQVREIFLSWHHPFKLLPCVRLQAHRCRQNKLLQVATTVNINHAISFCSVYPNLSIHIIMFSFTFYQKEIMEKAGL